MTGTTRHNVELDGGPDLLRFPRMGRLVVACSFAGALGPGRRPPTRQKVARCIRLHCAMCHGPRGEPVWPGAPDFRRPGSLMKTDAQLLGLLRQGRGVMPAYLGVLRDREMYDLVAHLRTLN